MAIDYSDGVETEKRILALLRETPDTRSSAGAVGAAHYFSEWAVRYHLSPERSNLLRHLDFRELDVLELGAGMGAVSRFLAEEAGSLTVIEGTESRYATLKERLKDLQNWSGQVANIQDASIEGQFDVVCVIGVLEYSELYVRPPAGFLGGPFAYFLSLASRWLKPEGVLILAIENRMGLKYWSGSAEDHTRRVFDGICGYGDGPSANPIAHLNSR